MASKQEVFVRVAAQDVVEALDTVDALKDHVGLPPDAKPHVEAALTALWQARYITDSAAGL